MRRATLRWVQRYLLLALVLTSCAKSAKEAPTSSSGDGAKQTQTQPPPPPPPTQSPPPPPPPPAEPVVGGSTGADQGAVEHARSSASLGVSADTTAFDPIEQGSGTDRRKQMPLPPAGAKGKASTHAAIGAVTVDGKPAPDALAQAIKVRVSDVQACYDKAGKPELAGTLEISFAVLPTGALANASVESTTLKNMAIESCVIGVLQGIKVAKPLGPTETKARVSLSFAAK